MIPVILRTLFVALIYASAGAGLLEMLFVDHGSSLRHGVTFFNYLALDIPKPFAYRVLIPDIAAAIEGAVAHWLPDRFLARFTHGSSVADFMHAEAGAISISIAIRYHVAYVLEFAAIFAWLWGARAVAMQFLPRATATLAPLALAGPSAAALAA